MKTKALVGVITAGLVVSAVCGLVDASGSRTEPVTSLAASGKKLAVPSTDAEAAKHNQWVARNLKEVKATGMTRQDLLNHYQWIAQCLKEIETIKPGMTRQDLLNRFQPAGGLYRRTLRSYSYKPCPYLKISVTFQPIGDEKNETTEQPDDKIKNVSQPYLEDPGME